ncbi:MAG: hypothetical protein WCO98_12085 [bacterium]
MRTISHSRGLAFLEILMIIMFVGVIVGFVFLSLPHGDKGPPAREGTCMDNQRQIATLIQIYAQDHEETLPLSSKVWTVLGADVAKMKCPAKKEFHNNYLYNNNLSGMNMDKYLKTADPTTILLTVDGKTTIGPNRIIEDIYYTPWDVEYRHYKSTSAIASFLDGHVEHVKKVTEPESWDKVGIINPSNSKVKKE